MKTRTGNIPFIERTNARDYVIILDDLEFAFRKEQLDKIRELHNGGMHFAEISKKIHRNEYEVVAALLHLVKRGHAMRPLGVSA